MELNHLKYFYTVAREGSFTRASRILRVQQPTISKMVSMLEQQLGTVLLERHKRGVRLTNTGSEIYELCSGIFTSVDQIRDISDSGRKECQGLLSFGMTDSVVAFLLPAIMGSFLRKHPKVRPSVFAGSSNLICNEIREGRAEFGVFFTSPDRMDFEVSELAEVPFRLVIAAGESRNNALKSRFIISRDIDYPKARPFPVLEMLNKGRIRVETMIACNNLESQKKMVLEGLGVALLPGFLVAPEVQKKQLAVLHPRSSFAYSLKLVTRSRKPLSRNAAVFLDEFKSRIRPLLA